MSALHYYTRNDQTWTDTAPWACVSPIVRRLCIYLNDWLRDDKERGEVIGPHLFAPLGTNTGEADEQARAFICADYAVRKLLPIAMECRGMAVEATTMRALDPITDKASALRARDAALKIHASAADAAASAADADASAAYAADAASATAATAAAYAAATADAYKTRRSDIVALRVKMILDCCAVGERKEVSSVCSKDEVLAVCK